MALGRLEWGSVEVTFVFLPCSFLRAGWPSRQYLSSVFKHKYTIRSHPPKGKQQTKKTGKEKARKETPWAPWGNKDFKKFLGIPGNRRPCSCPG